MMMTNPTIWPALVPVEDEHGAIQAAVAIEREACARLAEQYAYWGPPKEEPTCLRSASDTAKAIAMAIRAREKP